VRVTHPRKKEKEKEEGETGRNGKCIRMHLNGRGERKNL
jgi:hypothetical protein